MSRSDTLAACIVTGVKADGIGVFDLKKPKKEKQPRKPRPRWTPARVVPSKYDAACCKSRVDSIGRFPLGYCSPECERRP